MPDPDLQRLLRRQHGVLSRRQALGAGADQVHVARMVRRGQWVVVHPGVYVTHNGPLTRAQREWAALLRYPGSVLAGAAALAAHGVAAPSRGRQGRQSGSLELALPHGRHPRRSSPGISTSQRRDFAEAALPAANPPLLRIEHAAIDVASRAPSEDAAVAVLADVVRDGHTTPARLSAVLERQRGLPRRALLREVLVDVGSGAQSPLERRYLRDVERAHGLPTGQRQVREQVASWSGVETATLFRDVRYALFSSLVELDGGLGHSVAADRWADLDRDLAAAADGFATLRAGWRQVLDPCRLALVVGRTLRLRGWQGQPAPCARPDCRVRTDRAA
ncbi:MAG: type IV toxin-antitoxin system AbiEi family antitoxin domain-containing protein [Nocardioides sp.]